MDISIYGYGVYVPRLRIKVEEIANVWGSNPKDIKGGLLIEEKAVPEMDEDTITIAVEAARNALARAKIDPQKIGALYIGSESHPYSVKPSGTIVSEAIGATPALTVADLEFACKAGTAGMQMVMGLVGSGMIDFGLAGGCDTAQGAPGDPLEYTAAAGGACFIVGKRQKGVIAHIEDTFSYTTDTPDFWRRENEPYPKHGFRFTGIPAYFRHVVSGTQGMLSKIGAQPQDFDHAVFHQPNGKFPRKAAQMLGFTKEQIKLGMVVDRIGNTYSGSAMIGLANILDHAKPGERIIMTSFGSGAGADSFVIEVDEGIEERRQLAPMLSKYVNNKANVAYGDYVKYRGKLITGR